MEIAVYKKIAIFTFKKQNYCIKYLFLTKIKLIMKSRSLLILIIFLFWGAGSTYWYVCKIKGLCESQENPMVRQSPKNEVKPLEKQKKTGFWAYFKKNTQNPVIQDTLKWTAEVNSWKETRMDGKKLLIEGPYYAGETNNTTYSDLGKARAENIKKILAEHLDTSWVMTKGKLLKGDSIPDFINAIDGNWEWVTFNDNVKEEGNKTLIYFPYNSTQEIKNKAILSYLDDLADKLKKNPELKIKITGHTDNTGSEASNHLLGLKRAKRIRSVLIKKGVNGQQMSVDSKGELEPIADNSTEQGKKQNRRVEIILIK